MGPCRSPPYPPFEWVVVHAGSGTDGSCVPWAEKSPFRPSLSHPLYIMEDGFWHISRIPPPNSLRNHACANSTALLGLQLIFIQLGEPGLTGRSVHSGKGWRVMRSLGGITESLCIQGQQHSGHLPSGQK